MQLLSSRMAGSVIPLFVALMTIALLMFGASEAGAYEQYSGCKECHGSFRNSPYISLSNGSSWGDNLHNVHRNDMLGGDCDACHTSGGKGKVFMDSSKGGAGLAAIGCVGCHGREEDIGNDSVSAGRGAGLRQHHTNADETDCQGCHSDAIPANYTPVGEDVLPNYFAYPGSNHPSMPADSCNPAGKENFAGATQGLDNDGDGNYDTVDSDCIVIVTHTVGGTVTGLTADGLVLQNNGADSLALTTDGPFTFATELEEGAAYEVTVSAQPIGQTCSVSNGSGMVATTDITGVVVNCTTIFHINAGLNDAWYYPVTDGQGFFISVFPDQGRVVASWFTYDTVRPGDGVTSNLGEPGHRWFNASGLYSGNQAVLNIKMAVGGIFDTPTEITRSEEGTMILTFYDCNNGSVEYDIPSIHQSGIVPIQRVAGDNIALCEAIAEQVTVQGSDSPKNEGNNHIMSSGAPEARLEAPLLVDMNPGLNDAWYYPVTDGQGFFITVFPDLGKVVVSWFTYDTERPPEGVTANLGDPGHRWFNASGRYQGNQASITIKVASGGLFDTATEIDRYQDGTLILTFDDCNTGTVEYNIPSIGQSGIVPIQRVANDNIALCESFIAE